MPSTPAIPNLLASRYASTPMATVWSPEHKIVLERQLWVAVLKAQRDLGIAVPDGVVEAAPGAGGAAGSWRALPSSRAQASCMSGKTGLSPVPRP